MLARKLNAGALQLTLFVIVVIAILLSTFILLTHTHKQFQQQSNLTADTVQKANNGIDLSLVKNIKVRDTLHVVSNDNGSLRVHRDFWGVFEKVISVSTIKKKNFSKVGLIGAKEDVGRLTLYLQDNNKPLVVVGNTKVQGQTFLPKLGVKSGTISGHSYYGTELIYGSIQESQKMPELHVDLLNELKSLSHLDLTNADYWQSELKKKQSFLEDLKILYSASNINLSQSELAGHIIVVSSSKIIVTESSKLEDVILLAPEIEIKSRFSGNLQAIASKSIKIGSNCRLNYPSALILNEKPQVVNENDNEEKYCIELEENSVLKGIILFKGQKKENNFESQVIIRENSIVEGDIYCNQNLDLKGEVRGSVFTSNFVAKADGSIYQNHLFNAKIVADNLNEEYVGLLFKGSKKSIAKWLY